MTQRIIENKPLFLILIKEALLDGSNLTIPFYVNSTIEASSKARYLQEFWNDKDVRFFRLKELQIR